MSSGDLEYAMFTRSEMERRHAKARELMDRGGIDALLITGEENFQYFVGTNSSIAPHYSLTRPSIFILPVDRDPIVFTQRRIVLELGCYVADVREYFDMMKFPHDEVLAALRESGLKSNRIGAELGQEQRMGMPVGDYLNLAAALPQVEFVDAADIIIKLKMVKSAEELVYIREAADITGRARQRLYDDQIVPGVTERQVVRALRRLMLEEGADRTSFVHMQHNLPGDKNLFPPDRPLREGMVIGMDTGAFFGMYTVDYPRFAVLGKATDEQRRVHDAARTVSNTMADALRPGVTCAELHRVAVKAMEDLGLDADQKEKLSGGSRFGHGQGMLVTEPPSITPKDHTVLEPGVVLSTEPGVRSGDVTFLWEDTHVVTEDGHEQLTLETGELREIPF